MENNCVMPSGWVNGTKTDGHTLTDEPEEAQTTRAMGPKLRHKRRAGKGSFLLGLQRMPRPSLEREKPPLHENRYFSEHLNGCR